VDENIQNWTQQSKNSSNINEMMDAPHPGKDRLKRGEEGMILVHFFKTKTQSCNPCRFLENYPGSLGYTKAVRSEQMGGLYSVAFSKTVRQRAGKLR